MRRTEKDQPLSPAGPAHVVETYVEPLPAESPLVYARALADAELVQRATADEVRWLTAHPVLWMRALQRIKREIDSHIAKDRRSLPRPVSGADQRPYLAAKAEVDRRTVDRLHVKNLVEQRLDDVRALCGPGSPERIVGDVVAFLASVAEDIEAGRHRQARASLLGYAQRLAREHGWAPVPDNSTRPPIRVVAMGLQPKTRLNCRACQTAKVNPHEDSPRCPRCGQLHDIARG